MYLNARNNLLILFALTCLGAFFIFPEYVFFHTAQFVDSADFAVGYYGSFTLINFFQHGVQLWDTFDQVPMAFHFLTIGVFNVFNFLVVLCYLPFSVFTQEPAKLFHDVFSVVFLISSIYLRVVGCYLLFSRFTSNQRVLITTALLGGFCFNQPFFISGLNYGSYIPFLIHLTLNIFEKPGARSISVWVLLLSICILHSALHGGYLYTGIHFFIIFCLFDYFWRYRSFSAFLKGWDRSVIWFWVLAVTIILTVGTLFIFYWKDLDFGTAGRMHSAFNMLAYFNQSFAYAFGNEFLCRLVDFNINHPWRFLGSAVVFLSMAAMVFGRHQYKYIIFFTILIVWGINSQPKASVLSATIHGIHVMTNPMSFMIHNFQEFNMHFLPIWFLCLALIGWQACWDIRQNFTRFKGVVFLILFFAYILAVIAYLDDRCKLYLIIQGCLFLTALGLFLMRDKFRKFYVVFFIAFLIIELFVLVSYIRTGLSENIRPNSVDTSFGKVLAGLEYQNPLIFPWRYSYEPSIPTQGLSKRLAYINGLFLRYYTFGNHLAGVSEVYPRHVSYKDWDDAPMNDYLNKSHPMFMFVDDKNTSSALRFNYMVIQPEQMYLMHWQEGKVLVQFPLYGVTSHLASTVFGNDANNLQVYIIEDQQKNVYRRLRPAQGWLIETNSFDISNVRTDYLTMMFDMKDYPVDKPILLAVLDLSQQGIVQINRWSHDAYSFKFIKDKEGMMVVHYPYDMKWKVTIDGTQTPFYRINKSFIGFNIPTGEHRVEMRYDPDSPLRWLLMLLMFSVVGALLYIIYKEMVDVVALRKKCPK